MLLTRVIGNTHIVYTEEYFPGTTIRGMFANRYILLKKLKEEAHKDKGFNRWFLRGDLIFTNAYIEGPNDWLGYYPTPFSIQEEKGGEMIYDLLWMKEPPKEQTKMLGGFCRLKDELLYTQEVKKSLNFHHVRDPLTNTAKEEGFFNYEGIEPRQNFHGYIIGTKDDLAEFSNLFAASSVVYMGRSKNAQYGKVLFQLVDNEPKPFHSETGHPGPYNGLMKEKRPLYLNSASFDQEEDIDDEPEEHEEKEDNRISLTLLSDTIIYDENGFPSPNTEILSKRYLNTKILNSFAKTGDTETFVSVWRLRRPSEACFLAGSCFLIEVTDRNEAALLRFLTHGLGERCNEGFGRIALNWQTKPRYSDYADLGRIPCEKVLLLTSAGKVEKEKPKFKIPYIARDIASGAIESLLFQQVELNALRDASTFVINEENQCLPSKSLISRVELMLKMCSQQDKDIYFFKASLKKMEEKKAGKALMNCKSEKLTESLWDHLLEFDLDLTSMIQEMRNNKLNQLIEEINFDLDNSMLKNRISLKYIEIFLSAMRRLLKIQEQEVGYA